MGDRMEEHSGLESSSRQLDPSQMKLG
jgi:hypothetical protein